MLNFLIIVIAGPRGSIRSGLDRRGANIKGYYKIFRIDFYQCLLTNVTSAKNEERKQSARFSVATFRIRSLIGGRALVPDWGVALGARHLERLERLLSQADHDFVEAIECDLKFFAAAAKSDRVLVFPPVSNYRRFLIHKTAEGLNEDQIATFSIGLGEDRRTVVCYGRQIVKRNEDKMVVEKGSKCNRDYNKHGGESSGLYRPPQVRMQQAQQPHRENPARVRRPDRAVYVPKARRTIEPTSPQPAANPESPHHDIEETHTTNTVVSPPSPPPPKDVKQETTPSSAKIKRTVDKSFCNVYKPPHARVINVLPNEISLPVRNVHLDFSDSPIRTDVTEPFIKVPKQTVPNCESVAAPLPLENNIIEEDTLNDAICSENDADGAATPAADIEHFDNAAVDSTEYVITHMNEYNSINHDNKIMEPLSEYTDVIDDVDKNNWKDEKDEDKEQKELIKASEEINRSNRRLIKQSFVSDVLVISGPDEDNKELSPEQSFESVVDVKNDKSKDSPNKSAFNPEEEDWEDLFDENGEWLGANLMEELTLAVGQVTVQKPRRSYENYLSNVPQAFAHVLEVYNFPSEFTQNDLLSVFSDFKDTGFEIKWVDDNHALAVFSSNEIAAQVLAYNHPLVKTRPLHEATIESRTKAKKLAEFLRPYKARPETCTALARRLVSGALGVRFPTQAAERLQEKQKISLAREKKRLAAQNREAAWNGSLTSDV